MTGVQRPSVRLRRMRWWDVERAVPLEARLFPQDPWPAETFWSELAHPESRHYVVAEDVTAPHPVAEHMNSEQMNSEHMNSEHMNSEHVNEEAAELAGYAGLMVNGGEGDVQTLAVAPAYQRRGIGGMLLEELLNEAARRGCHAVLLEVRPGNAPAQALYSRHGFEVIARRRDYYGPGEDAVVMRLRAPDRRRAVT